MWIYYKNPEIIRDYVRSDVELVKKCARVVISIKGNEIFISNQDNWKINVIAVMGSGNIIGNGMFFEEVVLLEIGIGSTRPYHDSCVGKQWLHKRKKWFQITKEQYLLVRDLIFGLIKDIAKERINKWKSQSRWIKCERSRFTVRSGVKTQETQKEYPLGAVFSFSKKDILILSDMCKLEFFNPYIYRYLRGFAKILDKCIYYEKIKIAESKLRAENVRRFLPHHFLFLLSCKKNTARRKILIEMIESNELCFQDELEKAEKLLEHSTINRFDGMQVQSYTPQLRRISRKEQNFIAFEISKKFKEEEVEKRESGNFPF